MARIRIQTTEFSVCLITGSVYGCSVPSNAHAHEWRLCKDTRVHVHTHQSIYIYIYMHTYIKMYIHIHVCIYIHACICIYIHTYMHTYMYIYIYFIYTHKPTCDRTCRPSHRSCATTNALCCPTQLYVCMYIYIFAYVHT